MQSDKTIFAPFVRKSDSTSRVMADVILALLPCIAMSYLAFGFVPVMVILVAVGSALLTEFLFSIIFSKSTESLSDGSAIISGILLAFTIAPFTPLYVVAFGGSMAVLFGKLLWGGLGRNIFNDSFINQLFYKASGAIGEYSILFLVLGGLFLLIRQRISWHIPFALLAAFTVLLLTVSNLTEYTMQFSLGGLLLGTIFMATDMPTSASTNYGKLYYGAMIGLTAILCIINDVKYEYMSYSILLLNAFVVPINWVFRPNVWGQKLDLLTRLWQGLSLTACILMATFAVIYLHHAELIMYLVFIYIAYCIIRFIAKGIKAE